MQAKPLLRPLRQSINRPTQIEPCRTSSIGPLRASTTPSAFATLRVAPVRRRSPKPDEGALVVRLLRRFPNQLELRATSMFGKGADDAKFRVLIVQGCCSLRQRQRQRLRLVKEYPVARDGGSPSSSSRSTATGEGSERGRRKRGRRRGEQCLKGGRERLSACRDAFQAKNRRKERKGLVECHFSGSFAYSLGVRLGRPSYLQVTTTAHPSTQQPPRIFACVRAGRSSPMRASQHCSL